MVDPNGPKPDDYYWVMTTGLFVYAVSLMATIGSKPTPENEKIKKHRLLYITIPIVLIFLPLPLAYLLLGSNYADFFSITPFHTAWLKMLEMRYRFPYPGLVYLSALIVFFIQCYRRPSFAWYFWFFIVCALLGPSGNFMVMIAH